MVARFNGARSAKLLLPPVNFGFKFQRVDLEDKPVIHAIADYVVDTSRGTVIENLGARISTIEHSLAALTGMDLDNVLIEIGVARAWYGRKYILLVEEGVSLPSNLQGLYECRYSGSELNMDAAFKLLEAFADFRDKPVS